MGAWSFAGAFLQLPRGYHNSVAEGTRSLRETLAREAGPCGPATKFYLTGYSQALRQAAADVFQRGASYTTHYWGGASLLNIVGVALFGDPYFNSFDGVVDRGSFVRGLDGNLGTRPVFDRVRRPHVMSFCHRFDPVCQGGALTGAEVALFRFSRHNNYDELGEPERAARYFAKLD